MKKLNNVVTSVMKNKSQDELSSVIILDTKNSSFLAYLSEFVNSLFRSSILSVFSHIQDVTKRTQVTTKEAIRTEITDKFLITTIIIQKEFNKLPNSISINIIKPICKKIRRELPSLIKSSSNAENFLRKLKYHTFYIPSSQIVFDESYQIFVFDFSEDEELHEIFGVEDRICPFVLNKTEKPNFIKCWVDPICPFIKGFTILDKMPSEIRLSKEHYQYVMSIIQLPTRTIMSSSAIELIADSVTSHNNIQITESERRKFSSIMMLTQNSTNLLFGIDTKNFEPFNFPKDYYLSLLQGCVDTLNTTSNLKLREAIIAKTKKVLKFSISDTVREVVRYCKEQQITLILYKNDIPEITQTLNFNTVEITRDNFFSILQTLIIQNLLRMTNNDSSLSVKILTPETYNPSSKRRKKKKIRERLICCRCNTPYKFNRDRSLIYCKSCKLMINSTINNLLTYLKNYIEKSIPGYADELFKKINFNYLYSSTSRGNYQKKIVSSKFFSNIKIPSKSQKKDKLK